jgi:hypothetical protein
MFETSSNELTTELLCGFLKNITFELPLSAIVTRSLFCSCETHPSDHYTTAIAIKVLKNFEFQQHEYLHSNFQQSKLRSKLSVLRFFMCLKIMFKQISISFPNNFCSSTLSTILNFKTKSTRPLDLDLHLT